MSITVPLKRPKLSTEVDFNAVLSVGTAVESDSEDSIFIPILLASQDPPSFTVAACTTTNASAAVTTTTPNGFADVKVGDPVTGTGIAGGTTVSAKNVNNLSLTLSANATASGTVVLTFDPPNVVTPTLYAIKVTNNRSGKQILPTVQLYTYDGTLGATAGTAANATATFNLAASSGSPSVDTDAFLTNLRVPKTNS